VSRWSVELQGDLSDLTSLSERLNGSVLIIKTPSGFELTSDDWDGLPSPQAVLQAAVTLLPVITSLALFELDARDAITAPSVVVEYGDEGLRTPHAFAFPGTAEARGRVFAPTIVTVEPDGTTSESRPPLLDSIVGLAEQDVAVHRAMAFLAIRPPTYHTLYAALDAVAHDRQTGGLRGVYRRNGKAAVRRFKQTANSWRALGLRARHGHDETPPPARPVSIDEADTLIREVIRAWVIEKLGSTLS